MIGIGRHTDYASRIILHLSALPAGAQVTADSIAKRKLLPRAFMRRVVVRLAAANLLRTVRGAGGGVALARPASEISLLDVVTAMEGGLKLNVCVDDPRACPLSPACPVQRAWTDVTGQLETLLSRIRFDRLANALERQPVQPNAPRRLRAARAAKKVGKGVEHGRA
jgi:Rrf2 family protein